MTATRALLDRTRVARLAVLLPVVVLLVAVAATGWWSDQPRRFGEVSGSYGLAAAKVGRPLLFGMYADPGRGSVTLRRVAPRVEQNTAGADIRVVLCRARPGVGALSVDQATAEQRCSALLPLGGSSLRRVSGPESLQLLVEVVPHRPGHVYVDGVEIAYRAGLWWATESSGFAVDVTAVA